MVTELGLRERAAEALAASRAEREEREREIQARQEGFRRDALQECLKTVLGLDIVPESDRIELEGITFGVDGRGSHPCLIVRRECPHCGKTFVAGSVYSLEGLGELLERDCLPDDHSEGKCVRKHVKSGPREAEPETAADALRSALREFLGLEEET